MTAEIAIINRSAVTLAADSAVTLTVRGAEKIYNAADKLFELSDSAPIGVMIYNNLDFMGVTLEVAIKEFRRKAARTAFASVFEAAAAFFDYLATDPSIAPDAELQREHVAALLHSAMADFRAAFGRAMRRDSRKEGQSIDGAAVLMATVQRLVSVLQDIEGSGCFGDVSDVDLLEQYSDVADEAIEQCFDRIALDSVHRRLLRQACGLALHRDSYSDLSTGFVFAGFGTDELSPSLVAYQIDGIVSGRLKSRMTEKVVTNRREVIGEILPFAQREMVDRFLYGIDPHYETGIEHFLKFQTEMIREVIAGSRSSISQETARILDEIIDAANAVAVTGWRERIMPVVKAQFMREVQDMILLMPKQELATLAEELVNLTSVKRKFSSGIESVGGPIDVALISRNDGFVWVHRKHYFDPGLNPRYFHRKFGA